MPKGMFQGHSLDVTDIWHPDGQNLLAVLVYPPDHPARIPPKGDKVVTMRGYGECDAWSHLFGFQIIESRIHGAIGKGTLAYGLRCLYQ
ncbi:hypothetical protein CMV_008788 [Castanea mollissima]|uniref:Uncharacterized protein n=1 Tax=Castanea mollissima TaxID=60419 RepID=A0A8J4RQF7_9ROSI|nr:hypothetical protein CMV_008788 [Castanea mollissima]